MNDRLRGRERLFTVGVCGLAALAFALRIARLGEQDLWGDEAFSAWLAQRPLASIFADLAKGEPHPPLYPLLLWLWVKLSGHGELALRYLSLLFGVATVPLIAAVGRRLGGRRLGFFAGLLAAANPFLIWYSQETRMYVVVAAFAAAAAAAFLRLRSGDGSWLAFGLAAALMIYSHYYGLLVLAAFGLLASLAVARHRLDLRTTGLSFGLTSLLYLPWVLYASRIFFGYYGVAPGRADLRAVFEGFWLRSSLGWAVQPGEAARWLPLFGLVALAGLIGSATNALAFKRAPVSTTGGNGHSRGTLLLAWLFVPLLGGYLISLFRPMYAERYLIVATLPFVILVAAGIVALMRWRLVAAVALVLVLGVSLAALRDQYFDHRYVKSEYSQHTRQIEELSKDRDGIILDAPSQGFLLDYYYSGRLPHYPLPRDVPLREADTERELRELVQRHSGLWLLLYATHDYDPGDFVERWLSNNAYRAWHSWTINGQLAYYAAYPDSALASQSGTAQFGGAAALRSFAMPSSDFAAGDVVPVRLSWQALAAPGRDLKVSLRLRDDEGYVWGQTDAQPVSGFRPTRVWKAGDVVDDRLGVLILPGTPPGRYVLELRLYPENGPALPATANGMIAEGPAVRLGNVDVAQPASKVSADTIPAYRPMAVALGDDLMLEGESTVGEVTAGQSAYLTALWRVLGIPSSDYVAQLRLADGKGATIAQATAKPYNGLRPPREWRPGEVYRWQHNLPIPPTVSAGEYRLMLALRDPGGAAIGPEVELRRILVKPRPRRPVQGRPRIEVGVRLGDQVELVGYTVETLAAPASRLTLTLYWKALRLFDAPYTVFTHLLDAEERVRAQRDSQPCGGECPTTTWLPGDLIEDRYELPVGADVPAGEYQIEVGMYDGRDGKRLPVFAPHGEAAGDRVLMDTLPWQR